MLKRSYEDGLVVAWARPKPQERLDTGAVLATSRHDQWVRKPWQVCTEAQSAWMCSTRDAESKNCTCTQESLVATITISSLGLRSPSIMVPRRGLQVCLHVRYRYRCRS